MKVYIVYFLDFGESFEILRCFQNESDAEVYLADCLAEESSEICKDFYGIAEYELY